jgi:hypothetical protein
VTDKLREPVVYFLDENLDGSSMVTMLTDGGIPVVRHSEKFQNGAADEVWIPLAAQFGYVIVTKDVATRTKPAQREAILHSKARMLLLTLQGAKWPEIAKLLIDKYPDVSKTVNKYATPLIIRLNMSSMRIEVGERRAGQKK